MTIGRIPPVEPTQNKNINRTGPSVKIAEGDSVHISAEAKEKSGFHNTLEIITSTTDIRAERIAEIKAKINDPSYINETILEGTADKIVDILFPKEV
ncbi:MAG: flagellar biosynthesis anti-sigma factor FlgM [Spirochaetaceae bacterium]|jgi:negative regulator of flagellin synthesis FlgM|nr:flagellar biosynthesis anti-sigma factor FlgM [Spirochaetaceae bacterium]